MGQEIFDNLKDIAWLFIKNGRYADALDVAETMRRIDESLERGDDPAEDKAILDRVEQHLAVLTGGPMP